MTTNSSGGNDAASDSDSGSEEDYSRQALENILTKRKKALPSTTLATQPEKRKGKYFNNRAQAVISLTAMDKGAGSAPFVLLIWPYKSETIKKRYANDESFIQEEVPAMYTDDIVHDANQAGDQDTKAALAAANDACKSLQLAAHVFKARKLQEAEFKRNEEENERSNEEKKKLRERAENAEKENKELQQRLAEMQRIVEQQREQPRAASAQ